MRKCHQTTYQEHHYISSQFGNCLLVRTLHNRSLNRQIKNFKKWLHIILFNQKMPSFREFLERSKTPTRTKNLRKLAIDVCKREQGEGGASIITKTICEIFNDTPSEKLLLVDCLHNQLKLLNSIKSRCLDKLIHQTERK